MDFITTSQASLDEEFWATAKVLPGPAKVSLLVNNERPSVKSMTRSKVVKETRALVIDIGTGSCKIGYAGEPKPSFVVSSTVGIPLRKTCKTEDKWKGHFVGREREIYSNISQRLLNPLKHGIIVDWDGTEAILEYLFVKEMGILADEHAILLSDPPLSPITNREKFAEMVFESFNSPAFHIAYQSRLSMYSYGRTSSLVVECGHGVSYAVPIIEGQVLHSLTGRADYAGADVAKYLMQLLTVSVPKLNDEHTDIIEDIKNKYCYVSPDFNYDMCFPKDKYLAEYRLPDGQKITIGKERFICSEMLFQPSLVGSPQPSLHNMATMCIHNCEVSFQKIISKNILLCGGMTMLEGFPERFQKEINRSPCQQIPCVLNWPERQFSAWRGGSVLASLNSFQQHWLYRREYEEHGPSIIYRKCL